jgi:hypothetical protein
MTRWEQIKCSLGLHDWGKWRAISIDYELTVQVRNCQRCNLQEKKP